MFNKGLDKLGFQMKRQKVGGKIKVFKTRKKNDLHFFRQFPDHFSGYADQS